MCRWLAYSGSPILMKDVLYRGTNSLVDQSLHSRLGAEPTNGDGFGVGWSRAAPDTPARSTGYRGSRPRTAPTGSGNLPPSTGISTSWPPVSLTSSSGHTGVPSVAHDDRRRQSDPTERSGTCAAGSHTPVPPS